MSKKWLYRSTPPGAPQHRRASAFICGQMFPVISAHQFCRPPMNTDNTQLEDVLVDAAPHRHARRVGVDGVKLYRATSGCALTTPTPISASTSCTAAATVTCRSAGQTGEPRLSLYARSPQRANPSGSHRYPARWSGYCRGSNFLHVDVGSVRRWQPPLVHFCPGTVRIE